MPTRCPGEEGADACVPFANAGAAADNATRGPILAVTPNGTPSYRIVGRRIRSARQREHNTPAGHTSARNNFALRALGADPRAWPRCRRTPSAAAAAVADNPGSARVAPHGHSR